MQKDVVRFVGGELLFLCPHFVRTSGYHKKVTSIGSKAFEIVCCIRIQSNWRGYQFVLHPSSDLIFPVVGRPITRF
jgi:hypothetical protein